MRWYHQHRRPYPWREAFAATGDPYPVWISEIMLQQTVIKAVLPVYTRFMSRFPTLGDLAGASDAEVREAVRGLGYYRRFRMMHEAARLLWDQARGKANWPTDQRGLKALPGIGDYTSRAVASIVYGEPLAVVDGNVERLAARLLDCRLPQGSTGLKQQALALGTSLLDRRAPGDFNQAMMELGQAICTPAKPGCQLCPLRAVCRAYAAGSVALAPQPKPPKPMLDVSMSLLVAVKADGRIGLSQRPSKATFLKSQWGFATFLGTEVTPTLRQDGSAVSLQPGAREVGSFRHTITKHRLKVRVLVTEKPQKDVVWRFLRSAMVEPQLVANLDRKAWRLLLKAGVAGVAGVSQ